ncbi:uncharacterized protein LOC664363 isoform X6 [Tribolium castaneum]|uniref:uncharacterized protein LOC664363 isoform X6 n=1 Tax=Tribolium castaneum TaxID=7070 RepID=UPI0001DCB479|nr:PREDICTED: uncharacterized protein LOC664363 isoform X6 [Tribolium castaneum]|eukprot:XP_008195920.1 PREDICTED: uncharacterized protein LOC664363 isoform X6 [Tribolium castaneum]
MATTLIAVSITGVACVGCFVWAFCLKYCCKNRPNQANQQEDVYNISSRVQGQEQGQWPTHDNHVSLEHFTINETNKYNDDPPTYEEAMRIAAANNNNTAVAAVPKTTVTPTSTSTSTANQQ